MIWCLGPKELPTPKLTAAQVLQEHMTATWMVHRIGMDELPLPTLARRLLGSGRVWVWAGEKDIVMRTIAR